MSSERQEYNEISPWWGEHLHRYWEVIKLINPTDTILDIACGNGFGSNLLANQTKGKVIGGDISAEAVQYSKKKFQQTNLEFSVLDGTNLSFPDSFFNTVVSFETIEHTIHYKKMLSEFKRVLKPGGLLVLSTPNILVNSPSGIVTNPFHTQEFKLEELISIVQNEFSDFKIFGQKYNRYKKSTFSLARFVENLFYLRGVRKIPIVFQERIMKLLNGIGHYPVSIDYILVDSPSEVVKCKTFFVVAKKI